MDAPPIIITPNDVEEISETFKITQNKDNFILNIIIKGDLLTINLYENEDFISRFNVKSMNS